MKHCGLFYLALFLSVICGAQSPLQKENLVKLTGELIGAYNSGDTSVYRAFIGKWNEAEERAISFVRQCNSEQADLGAVHVTRIRVVSATEAEALVQTPKYETWWRVVVITDSLQRFKEHHMGLVRVTDEVLQKGALTMAQTVRRIDNYIRRQARFDVFKGNVFIEKDGHTLYSKSFGNNAAGGPNTFAQSFSLASMGKLFTAISFLQLADKGRLSLDDQVGSLLPGLQNKKLSGITLRQLLTHTSGMGDFFRDEAFQKMADSAKSSFTAVISKELSETASFLPFIEKDSLLFAPGTNWSYSNTGFELLGMILEKITGTSYKAYVKQAIFKPAGMGASVPGSASGGGLSTVQDLNRFAKALRNHVLLSPSLTAAFFNFRQNDFYGYGSEHQLLGDEHIVGHSGGFENVCTELNLYQHSGYTVVILSNGNPPFGHFLSDKIRELLVRKN